MKYLFDHQACLWVFVVLIVITGNPLFAEEPTEQLTLRLLDADTNKPLSGIVRISRLDNEQHVHLPELIRRRNGWCTLPGTTIVTVTAAKLRIEALRGLQTERTVQEIDAARTGTQSATLKLRRFYDAKGQSQRNANTHLHIMDRSRVDAERYLREVPESDGLELVYLSHLRRIPDETKYISNAIVEQHFADGVLKTLSDKGVILRPGEEHRHNFGRGGEGFGHVMLLDISRLIRPVSIGPGIMKQGTDGIPLQRGVREARSDGATIVWCHNSFGFEDIPNWVGGHLDAQNIFDGGNKGSYEESFYRYLNLGMRIPFSTGTDWFIDDFSRVYAPITGELTSEIWLDQLRAGRSFITNGPLLKFTVDGHAIGDTLNLSEPKELNVTAKAVCRNDFHRLEIVRNGEVVGSAPTSPIDGHFVAEWNNTVLVDEPSWLAARTATDAPNNEFDNPLYSHTSPVYADFNSQQPFQPETALELIGEMEEALQQIRVQAVFINDSESDGIVNVYREGIRTLKQRLKAHAN